ncbi:MAG: heparinase II/III family protein [Acetobacter sp.]|nr:heparinase II/III family protein [Acetobacter sp.]
MTLLSIHALRQQILNSRLAYVLGNPFLRFTRIPTTPSCILRDPWRGDIITGERFIHDQVLHNGTIYTLHCGEWDNDLWTDSFKRWLHSFVWLRDLRQVGTQSARQKARTLIRQWIHTPPSQRLTDPSITGSRIAIWLGCYRFFADSSDDNFKQNLMSTIIVETHSIMVLSKTVQGYKALVALKGLLAAAVSLPQYPKFLQRYLYLIDDVLQQQLHPDGGHYSRNPEQQFLIVRELAEMISFLQTAQRPLPTRLQETANRATQALRAMQHSDGGLALFNGSTELDPQIIEHVISRASRNKVIASSLPETGFLRMSNGRAVVIVDTASPTLTEPETNTHAGMLSFEFSSAKKRIIVNCGSSSIDPWSEALRYPAAHSVLEITNLTPSYPYTHDSSLPLPKVTHRHRINNGSHWLEMSHNNYASQGGGLYYRRLYLSRDGKHFRGEELIENAHVPISVKVRFHLHPNVMIKVVENGYLLHTREETWLFRSNTRIIVEESIYLGQGTPIPTLQLTLAHTYKKDSLSLPQNTSEKSSPSTEITTEQANSFSFPAIQWALALVNPS